MLTRAAAAGAGACKLGSIDSLNTYAAELSWLSLDYGPPRTTATTPQEDARACATTMTTRTRRIPRLVAGGRKRDDRGAGHVSSIGAS